MAHTNLPVLSHPSFPQVFNQAIHQEVNRVANAVARAQALALFHLAVMERMQRWMVVGRG
jgi:hypothetical protein